ncbi:ABC1 kinase family protein [Gordonia sp. CPCC 205333]|uniref:ABC1 kinase family protein n=1 Tax=Gordonia sp. CPCC 205333 TaxID=3140790 RepID=UPI003AF36582
MTLNDGPDAQDRAVPGRIRRGSKIGGVAARHAFRSAAGAAKAPFRTPTEVDVAREEVILKLADDIVSVAAGMRGAAHKLGQLLGVLDLGLATPTTRVAFNERLAPLFASAPRWDDRRMRRVLERSLGPRSAQIAHLGEPIAAASIGQVYRGELRDGREVAIKIKYPHIDDMVRADLKNLSLLVRVLGAYAPAVNVQQIVSEVVHQISGELDFARELSNGQEFADRFAGHPVFRVPRPVPELCGSDVMVTEFLDGQSFSDACTLDRERRDVIGEAIYRFYLGEMYRIGRFSADPHPGNVLILPDGKVGFLDFGLCVSLTPDQLDTERQVFSALLTNDIDGAYRKAIDAGFIVNPDQVGPQRLGEYVSAVVGWHLNPGESMITSEVAAAAAAAAVLPTGGHVGAMSGQQLVEAHAFGRRNELSTCALLGRLEATAPWSRIAAEVLGLAPPATPMGDLIAEWSARG